MVLKFRRKTATEWLTLFILVLPFVFGLMLEILRLPSLIRYLLDAAWIILLFMMLCSKRGLTYWELKNIAILSGLFFFVGFWGFLFNFQSGFYFLWGLRNNARFFVYFFACTLYIRRCSVERYFHFLDWMFWVNLLLVLYQYFILGKNGDYLGGIFGVQRGCNGYLFIFMSIVATRDVVRAMMRKESLWLCGFKCMMMLVIATLAELKAFVLILALIILMASLITKSSGRKFWIIVGAAVGIALAARGIATLFPAFDDWFQLEHILETLTKKEGYTGHNDMNRLTSVSIAWKMFLPTWWKKLFGLGLGNCDYASFDLVTSPFYRRFGWMNYTYFSVAMLMLETGLFGMSIYMCNFITIFISAGKILRQKNGDPLYCRMTQILSVVCIFLMIYGNAMRSESAYMMYFALSLAFLKKEPEEKSGFSL